LVLLAEAGIPVAECPVTLSHERASSVNLLRDSVAMLADVGRLRKRRATLAEALAGSHVVASYGRAGRGTVCDGDP
jgi:hypothetical protein